MGGSQKFGQSCIGREYGVSGGTFGLREVKGGIVVQG
jgi:hypothetical protein